jgi:hypothetical protein
MTLLFLFQIFICWNANVYDCLGKYEHCRSPVLSFCSAVNFPPGKYYEGEIKWKQFFAPFQIKETKQLFNFMKNK